MKFYRVEVRTTLEGGRPLPVVALIEDVTGTLIQRADYEATVAAGPTADGDVAAQFARLATLEAEHVALVATLKAAS